MPARTLWAIFFLSLEVIFFLKMQLSQNPPIFREIESAGISDSDKLSRALRVSSFLLHGTEHC